MGVEQTTFSSRRSFLAELCEKALEGVLSLHDFHQQWPKELENSEFVKVLHNDILDGVEHLPGKFLKKEPDMKTWKSLYEYFVIYLDKQLLLSTLHENQLAQVRSKIASERHLSEKKIDSLLGELS